MQSTRIVQIQILGFMIIDPQRIGEIRHIFLYNLLWFPMALFIDPKTIKHCNPVTKDVVWACYSGARFHTPKLSSAF